MTEPFTSLEDRMCEYLKTVISENETSLKPIHLVWKQYYMDYRDLKEPASDLSSEASNKSIPTTSTVVDAMVPRIIQDHFDFDHPINFNAVNKTSLGLRDARRKFADWDLEVNHYLKREIWDGILNTCIYGIGFMKSYMNKKKGWSEEELFCYRLPNGELATDQDDGSLVEVNSFTTTEFQQRGIPFTTEYVTQKKVKWLRYHPCMYNIDVYNVSWSPEATSLLDSWENSTGVHEKVFYTKDYLMKKFKHDKEGVFKKLTKALIEEFKPDYANMTENEQNSFQEAASKMRKLTFYESYFWYDIDGDGEDEPVVALYHKQSNQIIGYERYDLFPDRPPITGLYIKKFPHKVVGEGFAERNYEIKDVVDKAVNNYMNRDDYAGSPIIGYTKESGLNPARHKMGARQMWDLKSTSDQALRVFDFSKYEGDFYNFLNLMFGIMQKRTLVTDYTLGQESRIAASGTARGIEALISEGNIGMSFLNLQMTLGVTEVFQNRYDMFEKYWGRASDPEIKKLVDSWMVEILDTEGNPFAGQTMAAIRQKMNVYLSASKQHSRANMNRMQLVYEFLNNDPIMQRFPELKRDAIINIFRGFGVKEADTMYPSMEQIRDVEVQIQVEAQKRIIAEQEKNKVIEAEEIGFRDEKAKLNLSKEGEQLLEQF